MHSAADDLFRFLLLAGLVALAILATVGLQIAILFKLRRGSASARLRGWVRALAACHLLMAAGALGAALAMPLSGKDICKLVLSGLGFGLLGIFGFIASRRALRPSS